MSPHEKLRTLSRGFFFPKKPILRASFESFVLRAPWAVCAHIWRGFRAWRGILVFGFILGLFLRGSLKSRSGSGGNLAPSYPLHTVTTSSRDIGAYENYMFLKRAYQELFKKYNFVGAMSPVEKVTGVTSGWNLIKIGYLRNEIWKIRNFIH